MTAEARSFYIEDPAMAKQEFQMIMEKKDEYDLDKDGVLDERETGIGYGERSQVYMEPIKQFVCDAPADVQADTAFARNRERDEHGKIHKRSSLRSRLAASILVQSAFIAHYES